MLIDFFLHLRSAKLPVSIKEYLTLLEGLKRHLDFLLERPTGQPQRD